MDEKRTAAVPPAAERLSLPRTIHLVPLNHVSGFDIRPGF